MTSRSWPAMAMAVWLMLVPGSGLAHAEQEPVPVDASAIDWVVFRADFQGSIRPLMQLDISATRAEGEDEIEFAIFHLGPDSKCARMDQKGGCLSAATITAFGIDTEASFRAEGTPVTVERSEPPAGVLGTWDEIAFTYSIQSRPEHQTAYYAILTNGFALNVELRSENESAATLSRTAGSSSTFRELENFDQAAAAARVSYVHAAVSAHTAFEAQRHMLAIFMAGGSPLSSGFASASWSGPNETSGRCTGIMPTHCQPAWFISGPPGTYGFDVAAYAGASFVSMDTYLLAADVLLPS